MLRRMECRLNFKNRPVGTRDLKGGGGVNNTPLATNRGSQEPATNRVKAWKRHVDDTFVVIKKEHNLNLFKEHNIVTDLLTSPFRGFLLL